MPSHWGCNKPMRLVFPHAPLSPMAITPIRGGRNNAAMAADVGFLLLLWQQHPQTQPVGQQPELAGGASPTTSELEAPACLCRDSLAVAAIYDSIIRETFDMGGARGIS